MIPAIYEPSAILTSINSSHIGGQLTSTSQRRHKLQRIGPGFMARRVVEYAPGLGRFVHRYGRGKSGKLRLRILRVVQMRRAVPAKVGEAEQSARDFRAGTTGGVRGDPRHPRIPQDALHGARETARMSR